MLSDYKGKRITKYMPFYVVFDLETTGVSSGYDDILEISAVKVGNGKVIDEFSTLVNPGREIPRQATMVNGISNSMVAGAPSIGEVLPEFVQFIGDYVLVGHNIHNFDMRFIYRDLERHMGRTIDNDYLDTLSYAKQCLPGLNGYKLTDLAAHYGLSTEGAHRALNDCRMNQKVFEALHQTAVQKKESGDLKICPKCGSVLVKRSGRFGEFYGCSGYPGCRYTKNI